MDRGIITINETGVVTIPIAPIWMTKFEIADLFGVFSCNVRKAIHSIYKNKELNELDTMKYLKQPDGISYDVYNIEVIIAVAFSCLIMVISPNIEILSLRTNSFNFLAS